MKVVGGSYVERCQEPGDHGSARVLAGSGLRAAAVLRQVSDELTLLSAIDPGLRPEAESITAALGLDVQWGERSEPVEFGYWTPLSPPTIQGFSPRAEPIAVTGSSALVFGMLEGQAAADVGGLVFDPQQPRDLQPLDMSRLKANKVAVVANSSETHALAREADLAVAARKLLDDTGAEVVVTKCAARGALVTTAAGQEQVGAFPTARVWPIGSGDVFAAGFAWAWLEAGAAPVEATRVGSYAASRWCATRNLDLRREDFEPSGAELAAGDGTVYLAAPFFSLAQRWLLELVRDSLTALGGSVFSPLHDVGRGHDEVAELDLAGLRKSTAVLALLDELDPGALFETGWARGGDVPVVVFAEQPDSDELKMLRGTGAEVISDLSTAVYRALWLSMGARL